MTQRLEELQQEVISLTAQLNATVQLTLRLVAVLEIAGLVDPQDLETALLAQRWAGEEIDAEARGTMQVFCDRLQRARTARLASGQPG